MAIGSDLNCDFTIRYNYYLHFFFFFVSENHIIPKNQNHIGCEEINGMEEEEEINKEEEEEGDDEDEDEEEERKKSIEDSGSVPADVIESGDNNNSSKILPRTILPSTNKRKNFRPRSIVANESPEAEPETETEGATEEVSEDADESDEKTLKNRRKQSKAPLRLVKTEVMDLSLKETRGEDSDSDSVSDGSRQTLNLKKYRHIKSKCHFDEKPQNLLSLLNNENNRFNNPFGIDLSKFNKNVAQNSSVEYVDDSDNKNGKDSPYDKQSENDSSTNQVAAHPGEIWRTPNPGWFSGTPFGLFFFFYFHCHRFHSSSLTKSEGGARIPSFFFFRPGAP